MTTCAVVGCERERKRETMCTVHALTWLLSRGSDKTPGREERRRAFVARMSARNFPESAPIIRQEGSP